MHFDLLHPQLFPLIFNRISRWDLRNLMKANDEYLLKQINIYIFAETKHYLEKGKCNMIDRQILYYLLDGKECPMCNRIYQYHSGSFLNLVLGHDELIDRYFDYELFDTLKHLVQIRIKIQK